MIQINSNGGAIGNFYWLNTDDINWGQCAFIDHCHAWVVASAKRDTRRAAQSMP
jgi:hypothetical protein